ncbi:MAG: AfsR/SARP family transcriptional regulator [Pseudonocardiaceae bacterium]
MLTSQELPTTEWQLQILGGFRLSCGNQIVAISLSGQRLLALLAVCGPSPRYKVAGLLWPEVPERRALACLRTTVWRLRRLQLELTARPHPELTLPGDLAVDADNPASVVACWRNGSRHSAELLPGWYDDWILIERERVRQLLFRAGEQAAEDDLARGDPAGALGLAMAVVSIDPLRESAHRLVLRAHLAQGNRGEARRHIAAVHARMIAELGVPPSAAIRDLAGPEIAAEVPPGP